VQFLGNQTGSGWNSKWGQIAFEWKFPAGCDGAGCWYAVDFGAKSIAVPAALDGHYLFGDSLGLPLNTASTLTLWVRKVDPSGCGAGCTFKVGQRYMTMRLLPVDGCIIGP
jgi:hypothetical protein